MADMYTQKLKAKKTIYSCAFAFALIFVSSCGSNTNNNTEYVKLVKTAFAKELSPIKEKSFPAVIEEAEEVNLAFRVAGPIYKIHVKEGQYVKKGQLIAEMDSRDYQVQKSAAEAQARQLKSEFERIEELKKRNSVSENDYEKMKAGKEMAEAKYKNTVDQLNDTKLYAPFSGYITEVMFKNGELVNHGTPIVSLVDVTLLKVEIDVPASMYIKKDAITNIKCTQENIQNETFPLTLYSNSIKANNNGLYKLYLYHSPKAGSKLAPGMNVSVNISFKAYEVPILSIPVTAIFEKDGNSFVWVVENNVISSRQIETNNLIINSHIGVTQGLNNGEQVVTGGLHLLTENETVRVVAPQSETNIGNLL